MAVIRRHPSMFVCLLAAALMGVAVGYLINSSSVVAARPSFSQFLARLAALEAGQLALQENQATTDAMVAELLLRVEELEKCAPDCSPCTSNADCATADYCSFAEGGCGAEEGECAARPEACPAVWDPVCGCDGQTYGNACEAASAGVSVDHEGECVVQSGCSGNADCTAGEYCSFLPGICGAGEGECAPRPDVCLQVWDPVCGCDGQTYANACEAAAAGVSLDHHGQCAAGQ